MNTGTAAIHRKVEFALTKSVYIDQLFSPPSYVKPPDLSVGGKQQRMLLANHEKSTSALPSASRG